MLFHPSDLAAAGRCAAQYGYARKGLQRKQLSATAYGSVMHHALHGFERSLADLRAEIPDYRNPEYNRRFDQLANDAEVTFTHYWHPHNIEAICEPVEDWLPRQGYSELRSRGIEAVRKYTEEQREVDNEQLMALEYSFQVPIQGTWDDDLGEPHWLAGTIDRLSTRFYLRKPGIEIGDFKTGKQPTYLRYNLQFTGYAYATTQLEFWTGARGEDGYGPENGQIMFDRTKDWPRRATWIDLTRFKRVDAGWRGQQDYDRLALAVDQLAALVKADIFPLSIKGEVCQFCEYRTICGGTGVPDADYGKPS